MGYFQCDDELELSVEKLYSGDRMSHLAHLFLLLCIMTSSTLPGKGLTGV